MNEADFIAALRALPLHPGARGLMDDCAVIEIGGKALVLTHDAMPEGTHFRSPADGGADMADVAHVEVDAEANLELVRQLDIRSTPTTLFLDSAGREVGRAVGAPKRDQVVKAIAAIA